MKTFYPSSRFFRLPHALLALFVLLSTCARTPLVTHYSLSAIPPDEPVQISKALDEAAIGIGPVRLPEYLDRPQIVTRESGNRLHLAEGNRWAEPLAVSIPRTIRENLATVLTSERLFSFPWTEEVDYQVLMEIVRFEGVSGMAQFEAIWSVQDARGKLILPQRRSEYRVPVTQAADTEDLVRALSRALALFSREIAERLAETASAD